MTKIIAIANQKGGVGKTTTAINLSTAMAAIEKKILLIDADPQGNASTGLGVEIEKRTPSLYDLIINQKLDTEAIKETSIPNLDIISSTLDLAASEIELAEISNREHVIKNILKDVGGYDYIFIDCPPALGLLTINSLVAANSILVPLQCEFFALEGLSALTNTIEKIKLNLNTSIELEGIVLTMYDRRNSLSSLVEQDVRGHFKDKVYKTVIPRNVRVSEAPSHGKPVLIYDTHCIGSQAYIGLAKEVILNQ
jgi:chromosome partitioning protein